MVFDALRGYAQMANGLTDVTRAKAAQTAKQVIDQGGGLLSSAPVGRVAPSDVRRQVQALAEELIATSRTNRDLLVGLIRTEVERAVGRLGLVGADELAGMSRVVERLQAQLDAAIAFGGRGVAMTQRGSGGAGAEQQQDDTSAPRGVRRQPVTFATPTRGPGAKKVPAKKVPAKKVGVTQAATTTDGESTTARKTTARKTTARKTTAKKTPAKRTPAKKTAAKKTAAKKTPAPETTAAMTTATAAVDPVAATEPATVRPEVIDLATVQASPPVTAPTDRGPDVSPSGPVPAAGPSTGAAE